MKPPGLLMLLAAALPCGCGEDAPPSSRAAGGAAPPSPAAEPEPEGESAYAAGEPSLTRNFYFVFDDSGSMSAQVADQAGNHAGTRIEVAKRATIEFLAQVPADVQMGLYALNRGELVSLGQDNRDRFVATVRGLGASGGTPLNAAIKKGVDVLVAQRRQQLGYGDFRVIVVTDGESRDGDIAAIAGPYAKKARIPLYTIGFCVSGDHALRRFSVSYRAADSEQDLKKGLEEVAGESESFDPTAFKR
jgi:uncharacterized protein with von Willebrand factor type A (vWA) domain